MEELRLLSNLETRNAKLLQIVLLGEPELDAKLNLPELRQFRQRIVIRREIVPLSENESRRYIEHRLSVVGAMAADVFDPKALVSICRHGRGIPREINLVCDKALEIGFAVGRRRLMLGSLNKPYTKCGQGQKSQSSRCSQKTRPGKLQPLPGLFPPKEKKRLLKSPPRNHSYQFRIKHRIP